MNTTKICTKCKKEKFLSLENFARSSDSKDGFTWYCKPCLHKYSKIYRQNHKEQLREIGKKYRQTHKRPHYKPITGITKKCCNCNKKQPIENFDLHNENKDGRNSRCKVCRKKARKRLYKINKEKYSTIESMSRPYYKICGRCKKKKRADKFYFKIGSKQGLRFECKDCSSEMLKIICRTNEKYRERKEIRRKRYERTHKKEMAEYRKKYMQGYKCRKNKLLRQRRKTDPEFRILCALRSRIVGVIKKQSGIKAYKTIELTGCSVKNLMKHLESRFDNKMTWKNYGRKGWHIDHIKPCASFDLTKPEEQKKCFHYSNLRPLWWPDNLDKSSWYKNKLYRKKKPLDIQPDSGIVGA